MTRKVIGLHGLPGSGKDTVADYLVEHYGFEKLAFADVLKAEIAEAFNVDIRVFHDRALKERDTRELRLFVCSNGEFFASLSRAPYKCSLSRSPRWMMQQWGDWRRGQNVNYFTDKARERIAAVPHDRPVVVTDVRFLNEAVCISGYTGAEIWEIVRPDAGDTDGHCSNLALPYAAITHRLDNTGTIEHLHGVVSELLGGC